MLARCSRSAVACAAVASTAHGPASRATLVGRLLPQPQVFGADGRVIALDELLGDGFALIGVDVDPAILAAAARAAAIAALDPAIVALTGGGPAAVAAPGVAVAVDLGTTLRSAGASGRIMLVRPDRYVLTTFAPDEATTIAGRIADLLGMAAVPKAPSLPIA